VTTVVVKPKSRGSVRLASANPDDMPLVSPNLLSHPEDARAMIDGQRFFLRAFQTSPLKERIASIAIPSPDDLSDEAIMRHCKRFVKTNYHPGRHLPHGRRRRSSRRARLAAARARRRGAADLRPLGDADINAATPTPPP
jgi:choline dehydrogenase-like flavoprotein